MCGFDGVFKRTTECSINQWCIGPANMTAAVLGSSQLCKEGRQNYFVRVQKILSYIIGQTDESINQEIYCLLTFSAIINCGGNQMAPDCSYCPVNDDRLFNTWCSGNCKLDDIDGTCKEIKGICRNNSYLLTLFIRPMQTTYNVSFYLYR